jgi:hypothetical protein
MSALRATLLCNCYELTHALQLVTLCVRQFLYALRHCGALRYARHAAVLERSTSLQLVASWDLYHSIWPRLTCWVDVCCDRWPMVRLLPELRCTHDRQRSSVPCAACGSVIIRLPKQSLARVRHEPILNP